MQNPPSIGLRIIIAAVTFLVMAIMVRPVVTYIAVTWSYVGIGLWIAAMLAIGFWLDRKRV